MYVCFKLPSFQWINISCCLSQDNEIIDQTWSSGSFHRARDYWTALRFNMAVKSTLICNSPHKNNTRAWCFTSYYTWTIFIMWNKHLRPTIGCIVLMMRPSPARQETPSNDPKFIKHFNDSIIQHITTSNKLAGQDMKWGRTVEESSKVISA